MLPTSGLDKMVVEDKLMKTLREIVQFEKARSVLFGQWGFGVSEQHVEMHTWCFWDWQVSSYSGPRI